MTFGQGYQLRLFRPVSGDVLLNRRRFTQTLSLNIWNIGQPPQLTLHDAKLRKGARIYVTTYMRIDHDFGEYTTDDILLDPDSFSAPDLIPELQAHNLALDVLFAYAGGEDLYGFLDFELGRQLVVDSLDWYSFDGLTLRAHTPWNVAIEGFGGLRVRDSSPAGSNVQEPDGTPGAECVEYVEGAVPGSGSWRPIDRAVAGGTNPFESEFEACPQRDEIMPTFGMAVETEDMPVIARLSYRRSVSRTPGVIGDVDRFDNPDTGLYPNEDGRAPDWGVNEERMTASVRANFWYGKSKGQVTPYAAARYSLLHGLADEYHAGVRWRHGAHSVAPEYFYSFPTFDGDSIFNVFSIQPYHDLRLTYSLKPKKSSVTGYVRGWARRFQIEAEDLNDVVDETDTAAGVQVGGRWRRSAWSYARLDVFHEGGYGGERTGGYGSVQWRIDDQWDVASRLSVIRFDEQQLENLNGTTYGAQVGGTYRVNEGIAVHVTAEENTNRLYSSQFRLLAVLDLAFEPEI